ncbi:hypothetical protein [Pseudenhygromyxa sp. WMMC2535]|uniref:hypothetical protein n=1 Tax=Pseudenhygromyxa sp. WMMC2535 TaxID=2712867 RepID=UPI0015526BA7|nr:hypothetical protein [Pseudenhygromyxa sp. WMMC2535]
MLLAASGALLLSACPAKVDKPEYEPGSPVPVVSEEDERVVRDTSDLYVSEDAPTQLPEGPAPGSGRPDESNGVCRLYAPKLPEPECCPQETGFDAEVIRELCGHQLYLGESLQQSCGYYYLHGVEDRSPLSLRASRVQATSISDAVADHDLRMKKHLRLPDFASEPIPGVEGAMWSRANGINWAFLPGWEHVRQVSWADGACPEAAMPKVLAHIAAAKQPPEDAARKNLVPVARQ